MAFETKEEVLEKIIAQEKPRCRYCNQEMNIWEAPPLSFGDGLGWGSPYLFVCFNDDCPCYTSGWDHIKEAYGHVSSYRCMCYPDSRNYEVIPVFSPQGAKGQIIDDEVMLQEEVLKQNIKRGFSILADCYNSRDMVTVTSLLLDPAEPVRVRLKAAEMVGDLAELEAEEPIRNAKFGNPKLQEAVEAAVKKIHERFFTRECPFCAEIIKKRAKICKHCGSDVAGL